jgi:hypothetical protein
MTNFSYANPTSGFNTFLFLSGYYSNDIIANKTIRSEGDTLFQPEGINVTLMPGAQLSFPVNLDHSWGMNSMVNFSYFVKPVKSNVSLVIGVGYSESPEFVQGIINTQNTYNITNSLIITSNISSEIDFTFSYTSNYSQAVNSLKTVKDEEYWYQSASGKVNLILWKGFTLNSDIVGQYNKINKGDGADYSEKYMVWNASMGKKFLKNNAAEIRLGAYDILNQNRSFYHTINASLSRETWTNAYKRYFLVVFTYNLRANRGQSNQQPQQPQDHYERRDGPGGPPPGVPPGGYRPGGGGPPGGYHDH